MKFAADLHFKRCQFFYSPSITNRLHASLTVPNVNKVFKIIKTTKADKAKLPKKSKCSGKECFNENLRY